MGLALMTAVCCFVLICRRPLQVMTAMKEEERQEKNAGGRVKSVFFIININFSELFCHSASTLIHTVIGRK